MVRKPNYYKEVVKVLDDLHKDYPDYGLGRHISMALADYGDMWGISDKEMVYALKKYQTELALDIQQIAPEEYVSRVIKDAENLDTILDEENPDDMGEEEF